MKNIVPRRGVALVIVLAFLVLLSALVIAFFSSVSTEFSASKSFADGVTTRQLADSAVNLVMGQIQEAATREDAAWASQPGLVRVYDNTGQADSFFKLYSSDQMVLDRQQIRDSGYDPSKDVPIQWWQKPGLCVDLNQPVKSVNPDPTSSEKWVYRYPVLDPGFAESFLKKKGAAMADLVEGFTIDTQEAIASGATTAARLSSMEAEEVYGQMPVRWLYVLKDGTITAPNGDASGTSVNWKPSTPKALLPSRENPIVGRIAFWADDECSKVNINTAGGFSMKDVKYKSMDYAGSYWDTPRMYSQFDRGNIETDGEKPNPGWVKSWGTSGATGFSALGAGLAISQPLNGEFQRYAGHPATTSLGVIFKNFLTSDQLYSLSPRLLGEVVDSTKPAGSIDTSPLTSKGGTARHLPSGTAGIAAELTAEPVVRKAGRLYGSVDELLFAECKYLTETDPTTGALRYKFKLNDTGSVMEAIKDDTTFLEDGQRNASDALIGATKVVTPDLLEKTRFFLTANNRSPDLNLYGRPRISLWPQNFDAQWRTPSDRLLAFCSTVGKGTDAKEFYFQRSNPYSTKFDYSGIGRNTDLFKYLQDTTSKAIPGFGNSFAIKYAASERDQILTEMVDYLRTVNLRDSTQDRRMDKEDPTNKNKYKYAPAGLVVPLQVKSTSGGGAARVVGGFGRFPVISEAALVLYHAGYKGAYKIPPGNPGAGTVVKDQLYKTLDGLDRDFLNDAFWATGPGIWPPVPRTGRPIPVQFIGPGPDAKAGTPDDVYAPVTVTHNLVRAFLVFEFFNPMQGYAPVGMSNQVIDSSSSKRDCIQIAVRGMDGFAYSGKSLGFPASGTESMYITSGGTWSGRNSGGAEGFTHLFLAKTPSIVAKSGEMPGGATPVTYQFQSADLQTNAVAVPIPPYSDRFNPTTGELDYGKAALQGAKLTVDVQIKALGAKSGTTIRTYNLAFPDDPLCPVPTDEVWLSGSSHGTWLANASGTKLAPDPGGLKYYRPPLAEPSIKPGDTTPATWACERMKAGGAAAASDFLDPSAVKSLAGRIGWLMASGQYSADSMDGNFRSGGRSRSILQPGDTVRSLVYGGTPLTSGDFRQVALGDDTGYTKAPGYGTAAVRQAQTLRRADGSVYFDGYCSPPFGKKDGRGWDAASVNTSPEFKVRKVTTSFGNLASGLGGGVFYPSDKAADIPYLNKPDGRRNIDGPADFDTGLGILPDGAYTGKADEGNQALRWWDSWNKKWVYVYPYFDWSYAEGFETFFSPNRQVPSAVAFGSLSAGHQDWRTLCFSPNPAADARHSGNSVEPKDHLLLDLFNMPIVEPYAISEPFSTAGRVNINYPIAPFGWIKRSTAMCAALQAVRVPALPIKRSTTGTKYETSIYKTGENGAPTPYNYRRTCNREETINSMDKFFGEYSAQSPEKGFFRSASQICEQYLYPDALSGEKQVMASPAAKTRLAADAAVRKFWQTQQLTGDNLREKPYADLYPRLTTKSNTFTVHMCVQTLRKRPLVGNNSELHHQRWEEGKDLVTAEFRGSAVIERYLNPQDRRFSKTDKVTVERNDYIDPTATTGPSLENAYRFRVISTKRFLP